MKLGLRFISFDDAKHLQCALKIKFNDLIGDDTDVGQATRNVLQDPCGVENC
jgi:hypothetical protein